GLTLKQSLLNSSGIQTSGFVHTNSYLLNYSTNTGLLQVYGDYQLSGSTLTLDYANALYVSTATNLRVMQGSGSTFSVDSTSDTTAVNQLVTVTWDGSAWQVVGSTTGSMGSYNTSGVSQPFPTSNTQFMMTITYTSPLVGDKANFALLAAS